MTRTKLLAVRLSAVMAIAAGSYAYPIYSWQVPTWCYAKLSPGPDQCASLYPGSMTYTCCGWCSNMGHAAYEPCDPAANCGYVPGQGYLYTSSYSMCVWT